MALKAGLFNGGTTAAKVSTTISYTRQDFFEVELVADPDNSGEVYYGPSTVSSAGANAYGHLKAGMVKRWAPGMPFIMDLSALYTVGSAAGQKCFVNVITAEGRRLPLQR